MGLAVHTDMATPPIHLFGTEAQKQRYLVPAIAGEKISCLGITEPDAGADAGDVGARVGLGDAEAGDLLARDRGREDLPPSASPSPTRAPRSPASARRAVRDGDEWVINGSKTYITNGPRAR